jgi:hypothetical protein
MDPVEFEKLLAQFPLRKKQKSADAGFVKTQALDTRELAVPMFDSSNGFWPALNTFLSSQLKADESVEVRKQLEQVIFVFIFFVNFCDIFRLLESNLLNECVLTILKNLRARGMSHKNDCHIAG